MQFKLTALTALAFATISLASPIPGEDDDGGDTNISQCNTGPIQCCNSIQSADSPSAAALLGLLGVVLQDITTQVGLTCSPVTALGVAGNSWYASTSQNLYHDLG